MVRRGQAKKREQKRAQRTAEQQLGSKHGTYKPPPRDKHKEITYRQDIPNTDIYLTVRIFKTNNQLGDWAISAYSKTQYNDNWDPIHLARADIHHGHAHIHTLHPQETQEPEHIQRIDSAEDLHTALQATIQALAEKATRINKQEGNHE